MRAAALNYRDQGVIKGAYGYTKFPVIPLSDGAGEVVAVGDGVTQFKVGDRVASNFFVNWTGGRMPADASRNSLGGMIDGVLSEYVLLNETGAIKIPGSSQFRRSGHVAVRGAHRLECRGRDRATQGWRDGRHLGHRRRVDALRSLSPRCTAHSSF